MFLTNLIEWALLIGLVFFLIGVIIEFKLGEKEEVTFDFSSKTTEEEEIIPEEEW